MLHTACPPALCDRANLQYSFATLSQQAMTENGNDAKDQNNYMCQVFAAATIGFKDFWFFSRGPLVIITTMSPLYKASLMKNLECIVNVIYYQAPYKCTESSFYLLRTTVD